MSGPDRLRFTALAKRPEILLVVKLRMAEFLREVSSGAPALRPVYWVARMVLALACSRFGCTLPLDVFGAGFSIAHIGTFTVNSDAKVGTGCRIHPGVTIGSVGRDAPRIGNDVFLGPNCVVVGGISIGDGTHIGPGVVVTADVPAGSLVLQSRPNVKVLKRLTWQEQRRSESLSGSSKIVEND